MPRRFLPSRSALLLAAVLLSGCDSSGSPLYPVDPFEIEGEYVLREVQGKPLPLLVIDGDDIDVRLIADTLRLDDEGAGMWTTHFEWRLDEDPFQKFVTEVPVTYRLAGERVLLQQRPGCPPGVECELPAEVEMDADAGGLNLTARFGSHRFERR
jgi:hypothetical protein